MYRILSDHRQVRERRDQLRHPSFSKPELLATASNQVWSWDITKLRGPAKWTYFYLYVILDIFSRYVVGWMLATSESATLAHRLIDVTCRKQQIPPGQLTVHADRGPSMRSKAAAFLWDASSRQIGHERLRERRWKQWTGTSASVRLPKPSSVTRRQPCSWLRFACT
jgi:transposase InsO family protein